LARVLIVDDTEIVRRALELALGRMGHAAVSASSAVEALAIASDDPPDLALVDFRMPGMSGADLFRALREVLGERCPKVLFVSATPADEIARALQRVGRPHGYVRKPFHLDDLARAVGEVLAA
jgi:two-component system, OmpR family, response regulator